MKTKPDDLVNGSQTLMVGEIGQTVPAGLSKREYFAIRALQAYLSRETFDHYNAVTNAIRYADELITKLNETQKESA